MRKFARIFGIAFALAYGLSAHAQWASLTASQIQDASGAQLSSGEICVQPVDNNNYPIGVRVGSASGQAVGMGCANVANGAITTNVNTVGGSHPGCTGSFCVPDTSQTVPVNACLRVTIKNSSGVSITPPGYACLQPSSSAQFCSLSGGNLSCNLDQYAPNLPANQLFPGPTLTPGSVTALLPGSSPTASIIGPGPSYTLNLGIPTTNFVAGAVTVGPNANSEAVSLTPSGNGYALNLTLPLAPSATDTTKLPLAGGTLTGTFGVGSTVRGAINCDGVHDVTSAINALLAAYPNGADIKPVGGTGVCIISGTIEVWPHQHIDFTGHTLDLTTANSPDIIDNESYLSPVVSFTDAATTAGNNIITSPSGKFASCAVGDTITVMGAGQPNAYAGTGAFPWTTPITACTSATQISVANSPITTVSGATGNINAVDQDIHISNLEINPQNNIKTTGYTHVVTLAHVNGLRVDNVQFDGYSVVYGLDIGDSSNVSVSHITCSNWGKDCIHFEGPATNIFVDTVFGQSGDDTVAFTPGNYTTGEFVGGLQSNITVHNVHGSNDSRGSTNLVMLGYGGISHVNLSDLIGNGSGGSCPNSALSDDVNANSAYNAYNTFSDIRVSGIQGCFSHGGIFIKSPSWNDLTVNGLHIGHGSATGMPGIEVFGEVQSLTLNGFGIDADGTILPNGVYLPSGGDVERLQISHANLVYNAGIGGNLLITDAGSNITSLIENDNSVTYSTLNAANSMNHIRGTVNSATIANTDLSYTSGTTGPAVTVGTLWDGGVNYLTTANNVVNFSDTSTSVGVSDNSATLSYWNSTNDLMVNGRIFAYLSGPNPTYSSFSGFTGIGGSRFIQSAKTGVLYATLNGFRGNFGAEPFYLSGASAGLTVMGAGVDREGATWNGVARTSTQGVHVVDSDFPVDVGILNQSLGDRAYNTNSASGPVGPVVSNGSVWGKSISSLTIKCVTAPISHTGDTGNDIVESCKIPAGTLQAGSVVEISTAMVTASTNTGNMVAYIDLGAGPTTATINPIWTSAIAANKTITQGAFCTFSAASTVSCAGQNAMGYSTAAQANGTATLSAANDVYVLIYMQNSVAADTSYLQQMFLRITY